MRRCADGLSEFAGQPNRPVIIGACPRSGTTLLRTMLTSHPELAVPRETRFVLESWERRKRFGDLRELENRRRLAHWIFRRRRSRWRVLGVNRREAIQRLLEAPPTLGSMLAMCFLMHAEKRGKPRWGDKRPTYAAHMRVVWDYFPDAQFVNVIRDPRSCVASMRQVGWFPGNVAAAVELWQRSVRQATVWRRKLAPDQFLEIRYEDLVTDPDATLTQVARFAGLASDPAAVAEMLRYHEHEEHRDPLYHANVSRPLDTTRISRWSQVLDPTEVVFIEHATRPSMSRYGYEPSSDGVAPRADLVHSLRALHWAHAARDVSVAARDRTRKLITHRYPLAAQPLVEHRRV